MQNITINFISYFLIFIISCYICWYSICDTYWQIICSICWYTIQNIHNLYTCNHWIINNVLDTCYSHSLFCFFFWFFFLVFFCTSNTYCLHSHWHLSLFHFWLDLFVIILNTLTFMSFILLGRHAFNYSFHYIYLD